jgi:histidinol-phosphate phosphatase family protein
MVKRRCVILDRDGVINVRPPEHDYVKSWDEFTLIPAVVDWIHLFNALDLLVIVVTNQRGVARGTLTLDALNDIHTRMRELLAAQRAHIDDILVCPHDYGECQCRKPLPGLVLEAERKWGIDLGASLLIGDSPTDEQLARTCGLRFVAVRDGRIVVR